MMPAMHLGDSPIFREVTDEYEIVWDWSSLAVLGTHSRLSKASGDVTIYKGMDELITLHGVAAEQFWKWKDSVLSAREQITMSSIPVRRVSAADMLVDAQDRCNELMERLEELQAHVDETPEGLRNIIQATIVLPMQDELRQAERYRDDLQRAAEAGQ